MVMVTILPLTSSGEEVAMGRMLKFGATGKIGSGFKSTNKTSVFIEAWCTLFKFHGKHYFSY